MIKELPAMFLRIVILLLLFPVSVKAIPAYPFPVEIMQPDGSYVTLCMHGDEFANSISTEDGYTVLLNEEKYYVYAELKENKLIPTSYIAKNRGERSTTELTYLATIGKYLRASDEKVKVSRVAANNNYVEGGLLQSAKAFSGNGFRGLVILVNFKDRKFDWEKKIFEDMINQKNYDGFTVGFDHIAYTGSVRDYFCDNSRGAFEPTFDIVGPVNVDYAQIDVNQTKNIQSVVRAACAAADGSVNFADYDMDGDRKVDMVYFIFAGGGSNVSGNNPLYVWPHASVIMGLSLDGVSFGRYACSTELYGREDSNIPDGIGTVCHEFGHVLGLPDLYDTDYEKGGGQGVHPAQWSVMASGSYLNQSRTPCGYSLYERYALGWATPRLLEGEGNYNLSELGTSNEGYRINASINNEFFLLENRQQKGWDAYLPGHGMLVFRVDSTNVNVWSNNTVNANPEHLYYELVRANACWSNGAIVASAGDPFPGTGNVFTLTNKTNPALLSWTGNKTETVITDIAEANGIITFKTETDLLHSYLEDFEDMEVTTTDVGGIQGKFTRWNLKKALIQVSDDKKGNGNRLVGMLKNAELVTTVPVNVKVSSASFMLWNPTSQTVTIRFYYSVDGGNIWIPAKTFEGEAYAKLISRESAQLNFNINAEAASLYKVVVFSGSAVDRCYLDDFALRYDSEIETGLEQQLINDGIPWKMSRDETHVRIEGLTEKQMYVSLYSIGGILIARQKQQDGKVSFYLPVRGAYIIHCNGQSKKLIY